jgi:hypothetical protein
MRIKRSFLGNGSVNTPTTIEELLKVVYSVGSSPRLYNEDPRPAARIIERELSSTREGKKRWPYT